MPAALRVVDTVGDRISMAHKAGFDPSEYNRSAEIPFNSDNKFMAVVAGADDGERVYLKGDPGRVLEMCSTQGTLDDHEELGWGHWALSLGVGLGILLIVEAEKTIMLKLRSR